MFKRYDGTISSTITPAGIVRDVPGNAIHFMETTQHISELQELKRQLEEQTTIQEEFGEKFLVASKFSFDGSWDWDLLTNEFFLGEGFEELFGYVINNIDRVAFGWGNFLHPDDKEPVEKGIQDALASSASHWEHAYRFIRADGSIANVFGRASIIRQADGKACRMTGIMYDLGRQKELEEKLDHEIVTKGKLLMKQKENFKLIFNSSPDVLYDADLLANKVIMNEVYDKEFGYKIKSDMTLDNDWISHIHPGDKEAVTKDYLRVLASDETEWKYTYRFLRADNSVANVSGSVIILRNAGGVAYRIIGCMLDINKQKVPEERLEQEIELKEKQIAGVREEAKETEGSDKGKELHDGVNQLLGISRLYRDMAKPGGDAGEMYLSRSSEYTLTAIEEIRKLTKGVTADSIKNLGLRESIYNLSRVIMEVNTVKIICSLTGFIENSANEKFKLNIFRIVQEGLNNILKHARATEATIILSQNKKFIILSISDNGVGFDTTTKNKGTGVRNIIKRAESFKGNANFISQPGEGCSLIVGFPIETS